MKRDIKIIFIIIFLFILLPQTINVFGESADLSSCNGLDEVRQKNCFFDVAIATGDREVCERFGIYLKDKCYKEIATKYNERDLCDKIWETAVKEDCYEFFAKKESPENCEELEVKRGNCLCADDEFLYKGECTKLKCRHYEYASEHKCKKLECKEGEVILQGSCVIPKCEDSDKDINPEEEGICKDFDEREIALRYDSCESPDELTEFYCKDNKCEREYISCKEHCNNKDFNYGKCGFYSNDDGSQKCNCLTMK